MLFMNRWDIDEVVNTATRTQLPNFKRAVRILRDLRDLADNVSDGWCYWPLPCRAAKRLIELIQAAKPGPDNYWRVQEIDAKALKQAVVPIKSFLTKQAHQLQGQTVNLGDDPPPVDEQEAANRLEELAGGPDKAFRLMKVYSAAKQTCAGDHSTLRKPLRTVESVFGEMAGREGFSPAAVEHYLQHIR